MVPIGQGPSPGNATAVAAFQSVASAIAQGDTDTLATLISFDPDGRAALNVLFSQLPEDARVKYGSPEKLFATLMAGRLPQLTAAGLISETPQGPDENVLRMRMQSASGRTIDDSFIFRRSDRGWQVYVPERLVSTYGESLRPTPAASNTAEK
jgi:hypothetical protein